MAPLMSLSGDDTVEASLLEPTGKECRTSPMLEEEAILLGEELEPPEAQEAASYHPEHLEIPEPAEPTEWINPLSTPASSSPTPKPCCCPSQKTKKSQ